MKLDEKRTIYYKSGMEFYGICTQTFHVSLWLPFSPSKCDLGELKVNLSGLFLIVY